MLTYEDFLKEDIRNLDYSTFSTKINDDEFIHLLKTECSQSNIKTIQLSRELHNGHFPEMMVVDGSKHELRYHEMREHNYMYLYIIDESKIWKDIPSKFRSLFFWYNRTGSIINDPTSYILIPFNDAKLALSDTLTGRYMKYVNSIFSYGPASLCRKIQIEYERVFRPAKMDYTDANATFECLRKLNEPIAKSTDGFLSELKRHMVAQGKTDIIQYLDFLFGPKKNEISLIPLTSCNTPKTSMHPDLSKYAVGWTNSKCLMITHQYYEKIKGKF